MTREQIYELPFQDLGESKPQMVSGCFKENRIPEGMRIISYEQFIKDLMRKRKPEPMIRGFSIENVNSAEEYAKVVEGYLDWKRDFLLNSLPLHFS